jgi:hypothetical protein
VVAGRRFKRRVMVSSSVTGRRHRIVMALGLMLLAPTIGEYLLGNIPVAAPDSPRVGP